MTIRKIHGETETHKQKDRAWLFIIVGLLIGLAFGTLYQNDAWLYLGIGLGVLIYVLIRVFKN